MPSTRPALSSPPPSRRHRLPPHPPPATRPNAPARPPPPAHRPAAQQAPAACQRSEVRPRARRARIRSAPRSGADSLRGAEGARGGSRTDGPLRTCLGSRGMPVGASAPEPSPGKRAFSALDAGGKRSGRARGQKAGDGCHRRSGSCQRRDSQGLDAI